MIARAEILIEPDDQYSTIIFIDNVVQPNPTANQTLSNAVNGARDAIAALITGGLKARRITFTARIE